MSSRATSGTRARLLLILLLLIAFALRVAPLTAHRFHPDEALYATWALTTQADPALLSVPVDKPPLLMYLLAGTYRALGPSEAASRLPSVFASVMSVALLSSIGRRVYGPNTGLLAAAAYVASPFAIQFAPTVFTDPLLVLWFLLAALASTQDRPVLAVVALGLAYATKQQAVLLIPLVVLMCVMRATRIPEGAEGLADSPRSARGRRVVQSLLSLLVGFVPVSGLVIWWDSLRWHVQPSYWQRSLASYGGLGIAPVGSWLDRAASWRPLLCAVFASPILNGLLLLTLPVVVWTSARGLTRHRQGASIPALVRWDLLFALYAAAYSIVHVVFAVQVWDRYLLPLVPVLCLLLGRLLGRLLCGLGHILMYRTRAPAPSGREGSRRVLGLTAASIALLASLAGPAWLGASGKLSVGGDHGTFDGIDVFADEARSLLPADAILYYHDLGWHYGYYLRDARFALVWYPNPTALAEHICSVREKVSSISFASWEDDDLVRRALEPDGLVLVPRLTVSDSAGHSSFDLYLIEGAGSDSCRGATT